MTPRTAVWRLAIARMLAASGQTAVNTAIAYVLYDTTGSTLWTGVFFVLTFASLGVLTPLAGVVVDRFDRRRLIVVSELAAAGSFAALALVSTPVALIAVAAVASVVAAPVLPATRAAVPNMIGADDLTWANSAIARAFGLSLVAGPALGGALLAPIGIEGVAVGASLICIAAAALVWSIDASFQEKAAATTVADDRGIRAGLRFLFGEPVLVAIVLAEFVGFAGVGFAIVADAPLAQAFDAGSIGYAALIFAWGFGMLVGSWLAGRLASERHEVRLVVAGLAVMALGLGLIWVTGVFVVILAFNAAGGFGMGLIEVARQGVIQRRTPDAMRGRVFAAAEAIGGTAFTASLLLAGIFVGAIGAQASYAVAAGSNLAAAALICLLLVRAGALGSRRVRVA